MKLDKDKPYGTVHGGGVVSYEQANMLFDIDGNQVDIDGKPVQTQKRTQKGVDNEAIDAAI